MTSCHSIATAVNNMTTVLDSCGQEHSRRACNATVAYPRFIRSQDKAQDLEKGWRKEQDKREIDVCGVET